MAKGKKCVDTSAIIQVIGNIYNNLNLLDNEKYHFNEEDFPNEFHRILFGSIYNLHMAGAEKIDSSTIEDYLEKKPKKLAVYENNKGAEYLERISETAQFSAFDYYYQRMKKMSLLRAYYDAGLDISWIYDPDNILDVRKKQQQEEWIDNSSIEQIAEVIDKKIVDIRLKYVDEVEDSAVAAGTGLLELLQRYKVEPEVGVPLYGDLINTIVRGGRLKKFYLRSMPSGIGKTRSSVADACYIGCDELYNSSKQQWEKNGTKEPVSFITTEQEVEEIQTMMLAFVSDVQEDHILSGRYKEGEWERVVRASEILASSQIYIKELPDFSMKDIESTIKKCVRDFNVRYVFNYLKDCVIFYQFAIGVHYKMC